MCNMQEICEICLKSFSKESEHLEFHSLQLKHMQSPLVELERVQILKCDFCTRGFLDPDKFKQHRDTYFKRDLKLTSLYNGNKLEKPYKCHECGWRFVKQSTLEIHSTLHKPFPHTCECGVGYYKKCDLDTHRRLVHPLHKPNQTTATVPKAKTETAEKYELKDCLESESEQEQPDNDDKNYKPHSKIGPRLKAILQYKQSNSRPNKNGKGHRNLEVKKDESGNCVCPICNKTFSRRSNLNTHMDVHNGTQYKCDECPKEFTRKHLFTLHKLKHTGINVFECKICNKDLSSKMALKIHKRTHNGEKPFSCKICNKKFTQIGARNLHLFKHKGEKPYKCEICQKTFFGKDPLIRHTRVHTGEKPYSCKYCGKCFADPSSHKRHEVIHTGLKPHQCKLCPKAFCDYSALVIHTRRHQNWSVQCTVCNKSFRGRKQMLNHIKISHETIKEKDKYECDYCAKRFTIKSYLVIHIVNGHLKTIPKVECEICGVKVKRNNLKTHLKHMHIRDFKYECDKCGKKFVDAHHLKKHKTIHDHMRNKSYECDHCHATFFFKGDVRKHIVRRHLGLKCNLCKLVFFTSGQLRQHNSKGCKRCHVCNRPFPTKESLNNHFILHHVQRSEQQIYECDYCSKQFPIKGNLKRHIGQVHNKKNFICDHCNNIYLSRSALTNHIWERHMVRLYCSVCMKRFYNESDFLKHKHDECKERSKFLCEICNETFLTSSQLRSHLLCHGPKTKQCDMCSNKYKRKSQLIRHLRSAHGFK